MDSSRSKGLASHPLNNRRPKGVAQWSSFANKVLFKIETSWISHYRPDSSINTFDTHLEVQWREAHPLVPPSEFSRTSKFSKAAPSSIMWGSIRCKAASTSSFPFSERAFASGSSRSELKEGRNSTRRLASSVWSSKTWRKYLTLAPKAELQVLLFLQALLHILEP